MTTTTSGPATTSTSMFRLGWVLVLVVAVLLALSSLFVVTTPIDEGFFESNTGQTWQDFSAREPEGATMLSRQNQLLGIAGLGLGLYAIVLVLGRVRRGDRWAGRVLSIQPAALAGWTLLFVLDGVAMLAAYYGALTVVGAVGVVLVERRIGGVTDRHEPAITSGS